MVRKVCNIGDRGDSSHFGADDTDYINRYLNGEDQSGADPVLINTDTTYGNQKVAVYNAGQTARVQLTFGGSANSTIDLNTVTPPFATNNTWTGNNTITGGYFYFSPTSTLQAASNGMALWNPAVTFVYRVLTSAIAGTRNITLPLLTADDTFVFQGMIQPITGVKTFSSGALTINDPSGSHGYNFLGTNGMSISPTVTLPQLTANDTFVFATFAQSLTNKTIDAIANTESGIVQDPSIKRVGLAVPRGNTLFMFGGLADHTFGTTGTIANVFDTTQGVCTTLPSTAASGVQVGIVSPGTGVGQGRRLFGMRARTVCKPCDLATNSRFYFGFTSATALPISDTPLATTDSGVLIGWSSTDTNYSVRTNDGSGAAVVTVFTGNIAKDANFHTFQIDWLASGNVNVTMDGVVMTFSTRIPATTTNLYFNQVVQTTTTTAKTMTISGVWAEADK